MRKRIEDIMSYKDASPHEQAIFLHSHVIQEGPIIISCFHISRKVDHKYQNMSRTSIESSSIGTRQDLEIFFISK
jgi:hypothetical protein